jgi:hypothetical protein
VDDSDQTLIVQQSVRASDREEIGTMWEIISNDFAGQGWCGLWLGKIISSRWSSTIRDLRCSARRCLSFCRRSAGWGWHARTKTRSSAADSSTGPGSRWRAHYNGYRRVEVAARVAAAGTAVAAGRDIRDLAVRSTFSAVSCVITRPQTTRPWTCFGPRCQKCFGRASWNSARGIIQHQG